ncbi:MAG TPA: hypothetical protein VLK23_15400 [Thermodesulfobacteriota bacterium]|nr:hypothetical protein [Thermodesulfobacteriota bacterium]
MKKAIIIPVSVPIRSEEIPFLERLKLAKRTIGSPKILKGLSIDLDPYPGYFIKWALYPEAALPCMVLSLD